MLSFVVTNLFINPNPANGIEKGIDEMKYLIMCEGPNELEIIRMLLEHDK